MLFVLIFYFSLAIAVFLNKIHLLVILYFLVISTVTFIFYKIDKLSAIKGKRRIAENTLHLFSIIGGWSGAIIAQKSLRHKTKKQPFRIIFCITILINLGILVWLFFPEYNSFLQTIVDRLDYQSS